MYVLFISLDPERDTDEKLKDYVPYFYLTFIGLQEETYKSSQRSSSSRMLAKSPSKFEKARCLKSPACGPFIRSILPPDLK